jgi:4-amino-4-deoxy-L-arabinose transferase-like glycosyltransferase
MEAAKKYFVPGVLLASLLARALYALHTGGALIYPDENVYHDLALRMSSGSWAGLFHSREPLYPALVWLTYAAAGPSPLAVKLLQAVLSTFAAWIIYRTALDLFGRGAARLALLAAAFYPFTVFYDARLLRESLLFLLGAASLHFALRQGGNRVFNLAAASFLAGVGAMAKSILLFYWLPLVLAALLLKKASPGAALAAAAAFLLAVSPLLAYNRKYTGSYFLTRGQMFNLYTPLVAPREVLGSPGENAYMAADPVFSAGMALPEAERDAYFKARVLEQVRARPWNFVKRTAWRFAKLWRPVPHRGMDYAAGAWALLAAVSLLSDGWLIPLALWAAFTLRRRFSELYPAYVYVAAMTLIYSLSWSQIRYRLHLMPALLLLAAPLLARAAGRLGLELFKEDLEKC